jgi:hypothetical protein
LRRLSISRISRQIPERVRIFLQSSSVISNTEIKNSEISQIYYRALLERRCARGRYSMNILEICGDLIWLSKDTLRFSLLFIIPNALHSASIRTGQIQSWSENNTSRDWLTRSIARVIYSPPLSSPDWCARPAIGHSLGIEFLGLTDRRRS